MKHYLFILCAFAIALFTLNSCSGEAVDVNEDYNQQTILVFMPWTGDSGSKPGLLYYFRQNIDSICAGIVKAKGLQNGRVLVYLNSSATKAALYNIHYANYQCRLDTVKTYEGTGYTTADGIATIVKDAFTQAPALNYAMIIGCHGSGWTYKSDWTNYPSSAKSGTYAGADNLQAPEVLNFHNLSRFYGSVDDITNYGVDIETLASGLQEAMSSLSYPTIAPKLQYLLLDDCYMANVETAYTLRDVTNFLVASTSEVAVIGMPYRSMWSSMHGNSPSYSGMVSAFHTFYNNYDIPYGTLAAIDCRQTENLAAIVKRINKGGYVLPDSVTSKVQRLDGFSPALFYDFGSYFKHLYKLSADGKPVAITNMDIYTELTNQLKKTVIASEATKNIFSVLYQLPSNYNGYYQIPVTDFSGMTISDPSEHPVALRGKQKTAWWLATH
ncbi:clostripain-related cysteine peptidase [Prevotella sp. AGR2160]|uniref:clostripain-related cysteine peptidase n=1 Tax=Prevotella sp. AGR2160 TaxID=1280674 RepID=UPI0004078BD5|nr:clostripain-related cysteine peptidase [Prevotella sp. AGR2160]